MDILIISSQSLLYLCFSFLAGIFILLLVPNNYRPDIKIPMHLLSIITVLVPVFAFIPVLDITFYIAPRIGLFESLQVVLTTYTIGTAWILTLFGSSMLMLLFASMKSNEMSMFAKIGILLTFGLILTEAWTSHASAMDPMKGIISDFLHLTAVSIWVGILLIIGWCSLNHKNWLEFLSWFSKVAMVCFVAAAVSGMFLMDVMVDGYIASWQVSYGQGLLIKHILILPLLFYASMNGLIVKSKISKDPTFNPIPLVRAEGFILFAIFTITAFFSKQQPPHGDYLASNAVSPLFHLFYPNIIDSLSTIDFVVNINTVYFFLFSILFGGLIVLSFFKKASIALSLLFSCLFVFSIYFMLMMSIVVP
ncbi:copper resistance D family protein [Oceanobacillus damuensis]|uniref:copper resistance D family protein n=1 Tax=Oceanobacillus damuensis TaxID=937928 RepID=UPI00082EEB21|nr:CopD family protein [Oceanobacillus damuensis]